MGLSSPIFRLLTGQDETPGARVPASCTTLRLMLLISLALTASAALMATAASFDVYPCFRWLFRIGPFPFIIYIIRCRIADGNEINEVY
jgi:hypothetical protein